MQRTQSYVIVCTRFINCSVLGSLQDVVDTLDIKLEKLTNDVICYLAYETLGKLLTNFIMDNQR